MRCTSSRCQKQHLAYLRQGRGAFDTLPRYEERIISNQPSSLDGGCRCGCKRSLARSRISCKSSCEKPRCRVLAWRAEDAWLTGCWGDTGFSNDRDDGRRQGEQSIPPAGRCPAQKAGQSSQVRVGISTHSRATLHPPGRDAGRGRHSFP